MLRAEFACLKLRGRSEQLQTVTQLSPAKCNKRNHYSFLYPNGCWQPFSGVVYLSLQSQGGLCMLGARALSLPQQHALKIVVRRVHMPQRTLIN